MAGSERPFWKGNLKLSLVNCPVRLYKATSAKAHIAFNLLDKETNMRINMVPHSPERGEISRADLVKGYQYEKGKYVIVTDDDFEKVRVEATHTISLESFIPQQEIGSIYVDEPYYIIPDSGKEAQESFQIIKQAMVAEKRVAVGHVVFGQREHLVMLAPTGKGFVLYTLRTEEEVRDEKDYFKDIKEPKIDKDMLGIARQIIQGKADHFDPSDFKDEYEEALHKLIQAKIKGRKITVVEDDEPKGNVINLREALERSLKGNKSKSVKKSVPRKKAS